MRDKDRIPKILKDIELIWEQFPDLRLGQLICNTLNFTGLYYIEDAALVQLLAKFYNLTLNDLKNADKPINNKRTGSKNMSAIGTSNKGKIYIHLNDDVKLISNDDLDKYIKLGYKLGRKDK